MKKFLCILILSTFFSSSISVGSVAGYQLDVFRVTLFLFAFCHFLSKQKQNTTRKMNVASAILIVFALLLTLINCVDLAQWIAGVINTLFIIFCVYFTIFYTDSKEDLRTYLRWFSIGCFLTCAVSAFEYNTGIHLVRNYTEAYATSSWEYGYLTKAPTAFLYNPNNIAALVLLALPLGTYCLKAPIANMFIVKLSWYALAVYTLFMTGSRSGIIVGPIICAVLTILDPTIKHGRRILTSMFFIVFTLLFVLSSNKYILQQIEYSGLIKNGVFAVVGRGDISRIELAKVGLKVFCGTYFLGCGPLCLIPYSFMYLGQGGYIHMFWVELAACYGIAIFIWFCGYYTKLLRSLYRSIRNDTMARDLFISELIFAVASIIVPTIFTLYFFWLVIGFGNAYIKISKSNNDTEVRV